MDINSYPINASSIYTALKRKISTKILLNLSKKRNFIKDLRERIVDSNASEELNSDSLREARAAPTRELVAFMRFLDEFTFDSEELAPIQKEKTQRLKQTASAKALPKTNKHYASDNPLNTFATQAIYQFYLWVLPFLNLNLVQREFLHSRPGVDERQKINCKEEILFRRPFHFKGIRRLRYLKN